MAQHSPLAVSRYPSEPYPCMCTNPSAASTPRIGHNSDFSTKSLPLNPSFFLSGASSNKLTSSFIPRDGKRGLRMLWSKIHVSFDSKNPGTVLQARSMEEVYDKLAARLLLAATTTPGSCKYMVGLAGPPGAGKSTVAQEVVMRLNSLWKQRKTSGNCEVSTSLDIAVCVPMDGFHLYRRQLDAMEDPVEAHARRGAPWTFDPAGLLRCLNSLRSQGWTYVPSFDHGVGDPEENANFISPSHKVILVEGNYLLLTTNKWKDLAGIFDERWFLDIDIDTAMKRVEKRHIMTGRSVEEAKWRVEYNDRKNAEMIIATKVLADLVIRSVEISG